MLRYFNLRRAHLCTLVTIKNEGFCRLCVIIEYQVPFNIILYTLHRRKKVLIFPCHSDDFSHHLVSNERCLFCASLFSCLHGFMNGNRNFFKIKRNNRAVTFFYFRYNVLVSSDIFFRYNSRLTREYRNDFFVSCFFCHSFVSL